MPHFTSKEESTCPERRINGNRQIMIISNVMISIAFLINLLMAGNTYADEMYAELQEPEDVRLAHEQEGRFDLSGELTAVLYGKLERQPQPGLTDLSDKVATAMDNEMNCQYQRIADHVDQSRSVEDQARNMLASLDIETDSGANNQCRE